MTLPGAARCAYVLWSNESEEYEYSYIDELPVSFFRACHEVICEHRLLNPQGKPERDVAKCIRTVHGNQVRLDYMHPLVRGHNEGHEIFLGVLTLHFEDSERLRCTRLEWLDEDHAEPWTDIRFEWQAVPPRRPYTNPNIATARRRPVEVKQRPGQRNFRLALERIYGACCITGCNALESLEAAHIDPYQNEEYDHPQNGLLLRRDLHALFDAGLMGIDPGSRRIYFKEGPARISYSVLHDNAVVELPHIMCRDLAPAEEALRRRWEQFSEEERRED